MSPPPSHFWVSSPGPAAVQNACTASTMPAAASLCSTVAPAVSAELTPEHVEGEAVEHQRRRSAEAEAREREVEEAACVCE